MLQGAKTIAYFVAMIKKKEFGNIANYKQCYKTFLSVTDKWLPNANTGIFCSDCKDTKSLITLLNF